LTASETNRSRRAFTLIELLVDIAIIAVLASLLLPVLGAAKRKALSIACVNKVRQWGIALKLYADSNREKFPFDGTTSQPIDRGMNQKAWYNSAASYMSSLELAKLYTNNQVPIPGVSSIFLCPSPTNRMVTSTPTVNKPLFHYGINGRLVTDAGQSVSQEAVTRPSQTVLFADNTEDRVPFVTGTNFLARHDLKTSVCFVDGHVSSTKSNVLHRTRQLDASAGREWRTNRLIYWFPNSSTQR
jgi:prepilin-type N-terminal cleavage/methylation domain-containing protein/prepilin-type processing-associated H-X9-DG protein